MIQTLGFNRTITLVLTCPPYLLSAFISVAVSWSSGRFNERTWHITASKAVAIVGFILGTVTLNVGARYFAMVLFVGATYGVVSSSHFFHSRKANDSTEQHQLELDRICPRSDR
jgi:hypothetical protein